MVTGGMVLQDLSDEKRQQSHLTPEQLALAVTYLGEYGLHGAAKKAGFKKDDLIVEIDGETKRMGESEMIGHLLQKHGAGDRVNATVVRAEQRMNLELHIQ